MDAQIGQQLKDLRLRAGMTLEEMAATMGLARASSAQHYEDSFKKTFLPLDKAHALANAWEGRGMPPIRREEVLALAFGAEAARDKGVVGEALNTGVAELEIISEIDNEPKKARGKKSESPAPVDRWGFSGDWIRSRLRTAAGNLSVLTARGDSMVPTIKPGDKIVIDKSLVLPSPQGIFALRYPDGLVLKRLEMVPGPDASRIRVISDNPHYPELERDASELEILGKAVARLHQM